MSDTAVAEVKESKKSKAKDKPVKVEKIVPTHPSATKLGDTGNCRRAVREGLKCLWVLSDRKGLYAYEAGCRAESECPEGHVIGDLGAGNFATFRRDEEAEALILAAMG